MNLATARRPDADSRSYALSLMRSGVPAQAAAQMTGVCTETLAPMVKRPPRPSYDPSAPTRWSEPPVMYGPPSPTRTTRINHVLRTVAARYGVTAEDLKGPSRLRQIAWARQEAMYELNTRLGVGSVTIGRILRRDHTTALWGIARHLERQQARS